MKAFIHDDFLLQNDCARRLYHDYAKHQPIFDYHCHLPPDRIASDQPFSDLAELWLGDHVKWRAMRACGIPEELVSGTANPRARFDAWAATVPATIGNPLYHWTHLELSRYFGFEELLSPATADAVWDLGARSLPRKDFSPRGLLSRMKVRLVCTTDDPVDSLEHHSLCAKLGDWPVKVLPTFRPDKVLAMENCAAWNSYLDILAEVSGMSITTLDDLLAALEIRHRFFHEKGCRISDHSLSWPVYEETTPAELEKAFTLLRAGKKPEQAAMDAIKTRILVELGRMNASRGWTMQLHLGAQRNNSSRALAGFGVDAGCDSPADGLLMRPIASLLDAMDRDDRLPRTILYNLNPRDNTALCAMAGNFLDGRSPGKMQFGSAWWFNDHKYGMEEQLRVLASVGLLSRFVGMLTDSRSFLSYPRHEYFRRILCNLLGSWMEMGEAPRDFGMMGRMVEDISWNNAKRYFGIELD